MEQLMALVGREKASEDNIYDHITTASTTSRYGSTPTNSNNNGNNYNGYHSNGDNNYNGYASTNVNVNDNSNDSYNSNNSNDHNSINNSNSGFNNRYNNNNNNNGYSNGYNNSVPVMSNNNAPTINNNNYNVRATNNVPYYTNIVGYNNEYANSRNNNKNSTVIIAVVSVLCGLVLISAIGLFISCRKRTEKKKENIANAFFEFSADGKSTRKSAKTNKSKSSLGSSSL